MTKDWAIYGVQLMEPMEPLRGRLAYVEEDRHLVFTAQRERQFLARCWEGNSTYVAVVSVGYVEILIARRTGQFLHPQGYAPNEGWARGRVSPPAVEERGVRLLAHGLEEYWLHGYHLLLPEAVSTTYDRSTGWLYIAEPTVRPERAALFADGCIAGIARRRLVGLWLKPTIVKTFDDAKNLVDKRCPVDN